MGLVKKKTAPKTVDTGTDAAITRLKTAKPAANGSTKSKYKQNDPDKIALGKVRFGQFQSALESPAIAGMQFNTMDEYLELCKQAADAGVAYSFQED